ncbi:MAG: hypothetical protein RIS13_575 [Bacteroidota bacterium]
MSSSIFLVTPPFTQLNTPYPATAYIKGFLNTKQISSKQADLGIETILAIFSKKGLNELFQYIKESGKTLSANARRMVALENDYTDTIEHVIGFLQGKNPTLAYHISKRKFLPEASRFEQTDQLEWAFGTMGNNDLSKFLCTMYMEDLSDLIKEVVDEHFGFSRYAERLGRSANSFDELYASLQGDHTYIDKIYLQLLSYHIDAINPGIVAFSVPFPGNLYTAFRSAQWIRKNKPGIKVAMGGGFPNTELRSLSDARVFEFFDFITLDDGEAPIENMIGFVEGRKNIDDLKRTFILENGKVNYRNNASCKDYKQAELGTPDYSGLLLDQYISAVEIANPMHRLWSDGRWNKLTMAHGCYWGKCTFCDISLDYIKLYEPVAAALLCDRMEELIEKTGENGFHFVDEAAPPALMRALALEILKRRLVVSWWTNVRFEKSFTRDLCILLRASGCIAVSGGLEVASDRLLQLIDKGITVAQVAVVNKNFTEAGIMVHAYLMYGFPTETMQETIDSLEMVRQLFKSGVLQSGFWHQFAMTAHSPVGLDPSKFKVKKLSEAVGSFANNDIAHIDPTGADHEIFSYGLKKSLFNFMQHIGLDDPLQKWFDFKIPKTDVEPNHIEKILLEDALPLFRPSTKLVWLGKTIGVEYYTKSKKGMQREMATITFINKSTSLVIDIPKHDADWLLPMLEKMTIGDRLLTLQQMKESHEAAGFEDFELFIDNKPMNTMHKVGLLRL